MRVRIKSVGAAIAAAFCLIILSLPASQAQPAKAIQAQGPVVLTREEAAAVLPPTVFFRGKSASIQARNSAGLRFANGGLTLASIVDTSGYSSAVQQTYQAYLITEVALMIGGQQIRPGAYGFGFLPGNKIVVMDLGGNEILHADTNRDDSLVRPNPLQITSVETGREFRLYLGRSYVTLAAAEK